MAPSPTGGNGRTSAGQFAPGNKIAKGNPHASKVQKLRAAMLEVIEPKDVKTIVLTLIGLAQEGDVKAAKMILDLVGRPEGDTPATAPTIPVPPAITPNNFERIKRELLARTN